MFLVTQKWASYNEKLYSSPWICKIISWDGINTKPKVIWGKFNGQPSLGGYVSISANQGDIIKTGQKSKSTGYSNTQWYKADQDYDSNKKEENIILLGGVSEAWEIFCELRPSFKKDDSPKEYIIRPSEKPSVRNFAKYKEDSFKDIANSIKELPENIISVSNSNSLFVGTTNSAPAWGEKIIPEVKTEIQIGSNLELEMKDCLQEFISTMNEIENSGEIRMEFNPKLTSLYIKIQKILERTKQKKYLTRSIEI